MRRALLALLLLVAGEGSAFAGSKWVYTCTGTRVETTQVLSPNETPACNPASSGQWEQIQYADPVAAFDPSQLDGATLAGAFGAGFVSMATGLLLAWAMRVIVSAVKNF